MLKVITACGGGYTWGIVTTMPNLRTIIHTSLNGNQEEFLIPEFATTGDLTATLCLPYEHDTGVRVWLLKEHDVALIGELWLQASRFVNKTEWTTVKCHGVVDAFGEAWRIATGPRCELIEIRKTASERAIAKIVDMLKMGYGVTVNDIEAWKILMMASDEIPLSTQLGLRYLLAEGTDRNSQLQRKLNATPQQEREPLKTPKHELLKQFDSQRLGISTEQFVANARRLLV